MTGGLKREVSPRAHQKREISEAETYWGTRDSATETFGSTCRSAPDSKGQKNDQVSNASSSSGTMVVELTSHPKTGIKPEDPSKKMLSPARAVERKSNEISEAHDSDDASSNPLQTKHEDSHFRSIPPISSIRAMITRPTSPTFWYWSQLGRTTVKSPKAFGQRGVRPWMLSLSSRSEEAIHSLTCLALGWSRNSSAAEGEGEKDTRFSSRSRGRERESEESKTRTLTRRRLRHVQPQLLRHPLHLLHRRDPITDRHASSLLYRTWDDPMQVEQEEESTDPFGDLSKLLIVL